MGICLSAEEKEQQERNRNIENMIKIDAQRNRKQCKILLLGSGESGKSTVVKQMKIIHRHGYTKDELRTFRNVVADNVVDSIVDVAFAMSKFNINPESQKAKAFQKFLLQRPTSSATFRFSREAPYELEPSPPAGDRWSDGGLNPEWVEVIETIWNDPARTKVMDEHASDFYMMDNAPYFFERIKVIATRDFIPTEEDILRTRQKTTGILETYFEVNQLGIHMVDVGGQRSERRKWIHCFQDVTSVIFCVAISDYDQVLLEDASQNRMQECLMLFDSIVNSRWFLRSSIILFLNKVDVFKAKIAKIPIQNYFPDYDGTQSVQKAANFFLAKFMKLNRAKLNVYPHLTQATSTSNIRAVFKAVNETIMINLLKKGSIL